MNILPVLILMPILIIYDECYAPVQTSKQQHPAKSAEEWRRANVATTTVPRMIPRKKTQLIINVVWYLLVACAMACGARRRRDA